MNSLAEKFGKNPLPLSDRLVRECLRYCWPGNLRELGNFVKRYLVLEQEDTMIDELQARARVCDHREGFSAPASARGGLKALVRGLKDEAEAKEIQKALDNNNWNRRAAAVELGISYKALLYKIKQHGLASLTSDAPLLPLEDQTRDNQTELGLQ